MYTPPIITLDSITEELDRLYENAAKKENPAKSYIIKYKGKRLTLNSGKKTWNRISDAKNALLCHFNWFESKYVIPFKGTYTSESGHVHNLYDYDNETFRRNEFRTKLYSSVEIVELTE